MRAFPAGAIIHPFIREVRSDVASNEWVCFLAYPFSLGLRYPFPAFISRFFELTDLSYVETMPMVWRVLVVLDQIKSRHVPDLCVEDLPKAYRLCSHSNNRFLLFSTSKNPLILKATKNEDQGQRKLFFVKRDSIAKGFDLPVKCASFNLEGFQIDKLDSYSGLMQVKHENNPKPAVTSKPTSSKTATAPKASTASKSRGPNSRKRNEADSPATSDVFPFENHGFTESSKFMTGFLNQDACGLNKMLESKLKKVEATVADQAAIVTAKSQHYEDKYKAMVQEHQAAIQKVAQDA
ncbi:hypothetical protein Hanom_Chr03g00206811 [Helianthus anomalus]